MPLRSCFALVLLAAACAAPRPAPATLLTDLGDAPAVGAVRLQLTDSELVAVTVPLPPGSLPPAVRTTLLALAADGEETFRGRERGPRGTGYRIDTRHAAPEHRRSALIDADGGVLERAHTVPLPEAPAHVLATALQFGPRVDEIWIVSGPRQEEHWTVVVRDRELREHVVAIDLEGRLLQRRRRVAAQLDG